MFSITTVLCSLLQTFIKANVKLTFKSTFDFEFKKIYSMNLTSK